MILFLYYESFVQLNMADNISRKFNKDNWITMEYSEDWSSKREKIFSIDVSSLAISIAMVVIGALV